MGQRLVWTLPSRHRVVIVMTNSLYNDIGDRFTIQGKRDFHWYIEYSSARQ